MKWTLHIFIWFFLPGALQAQVRGVIVNQNTGEPIPYVSVSVAGESGGTSADANGLFSLSVSASNKMLIFSASGYRTDSFSVKSLPDTIKLERYFTSLENIVLVQRKNTQTVKIGGFKKSGINLYMVASTTPWMIATWFPHSEQFNKTPFLKGVGILTESERRNVLFNIRLYKVDTSGAPGEYLHDENILVSVRKGKHITYADLSDLNIQAPVEGFFVAVEWLLIDGNKREIVYTDRERKKHKAINFEPSVGVLKNAEERRVWTYIGGKWRLWKGPPSRQNEIQRLAIELTMSN